MKLRTYCECGGRLVCQSQAPKPFYFCDTCTRVYEMKDMKDTEQPEPKPDAQHDGHQHHMVCAICGLVANCDEDV